MYDESKGNRPRVAIYCRLSDEDVGKGDDESSSIQNQRAILEKYCLDQDWEIYKTYVDDGWSGLSRDRPEWLQMLDEAQQHRFDIILCKTQARFTRDMEVSEKYLHRLFPAWRIRFVGLADHVDTSVKNTQIQRQVNSMVNEIYSQQASQNIRIVFDAKMEAGYCIGSYAIYGYMKDPQAKGHWLIDPEAAEIVRRIFNMSLTGMGQVAIAQQLNAEGIPNPAKYKAIKYGIFQYVNKCREAENAALWRGITVGRILRDERYIGHMIQGRRDKPSYKSNITFDRPKEEWKRVENTHEPIISKEIFEEVQLSVLSRRRKRADKNGKRHPLAAKIRCLECGSTMWRNQSAPKVGREPLEYFRCIMVHRDPNVCHGNSIRRDKLEEIVLERLHHYLQCVDEKIVEMKVGEGVLVSESQRLKNELQRDRRELANKNKALEIAYEDRVAGILTQKQFAVFSQKYKGEAEMLEARIKILEQQCLDSDRNQRKEADLQKKIKQYKEAELLTEALVNEFIELVEVGRENKDTGEREIRICWKY